MEDTLRVGGTFTFTLTIMVLILVLMEDTLRENDYSEFLKAAES